MNTTVHLPHGLLQSSILTQPIKPSLNISCWGIWSAWSFSKCPTRRQAPEYTNKQKAHRSSTSSTRQKSLKEEESRAELEPSTTKEKTVRETRIQFIHTRDQGTSTWTLQTQQLLRDKQLPDQIRVAIEFATVFQAPGPGKNTGNGIGTSWIALKWKHAIFQTKYRTKSDSHTHINFWSTGLWM